MAFQEGLIVYGLAQINELSSEQMSQTVTGLPISGTEY